MPTKVMLSSNHGLRIHELGHLTRNPQVKTITLIMLALGAIVLTTSVDEVSASSKYEEMGPLDVHNFQTTNPEWLYVISCSPCKVPIAPSPPSTAGYHEPPARLYVAAPIVGGQYPVLLFKHGFNLANCDYSQLLLHIASYGYIVVAPQGPIALLNPDATDEIEQTIQVEEWLPGNLSTLLLVATAGKTGAGPAVQPDLERLMMSGHSRGGKVAFAMALGLLSGSRHHTKYLGLFTLDPVDGTGLGPSNPPIVTRDDVEIAFPVFILGTGYGGQGSLVPMTLPCAPTCCDYKAYAKATHAPVVYDLVASDYGHLDFLDDSTFWTYLICKSGDSKEPVRNASAALLLAFFESILTTSPKPLAHAISDASIRLERSSSNACFSAFCPA